MLNAIKTVAQNISINPTGSILVHFWGLEEDKQLFESFSEEMNMLYDQVHCVYLSDSFIFSAAKSNQLSIEEIYGDFDIDKAMTVVDLCRYAPTSLVTQLSGEARANFVTFIRGIFAHATSNNRSFIQLRLPSPANATEAGLSYESYELIWKTLVDIDYIALEQSCKEKIEVFKPYNHIKLQTGDRYVLEFNLSGREWHIDAGNGDFPAGEIYIAPLESSASGQFLTDLIHWEGEFFKSVLLEFKEGILINCSEKTILEDLKQAPGDAMRIAEFGIGLNPGYKLSKGITGCTLFDEKLLGTCHIAVGMNNLFGGQNDSPVHVDFVSTDFEIL
ncbi:aminopeptidase [Fusibacter bizertensis]|uniref:Aminopeptidase n=1 Tax=Fusibacter bizertensis TaxID=1488331 RepID=A0ABT6NEH1_9FIRM|nr:aminopeptidase [Fusibacter bizertensis]MDH8678808.1 aminopeptidase [Fusibacter bizertensis]